MERIENVKQPERALLAAVDTGEYDVEASLAELYELVRSAGAVSYTHLTLPTT